MSCKSTMAERCFYCNIEETLLHEAPCERHGSAMSRMSAIGEKCFHSNIDKKIQMEGAMGASCKHLVSNVGGKVPHGGPPHLFSGQRNLTWWDAIGAAFRHVNCFLLANPHYFIQLICRH